MKILKYTEYLYLAVAIVSIYKIITLWNTEEDVYLFIFFAVVSAGMFVFRRNYRKKFEQRKKDQNN